MSLRPRSGTFCRLAIWAPYRLDPSFRLLFVTTSRANRRDVHAPSFHFTFEGVKILVKVFERGPTAEFDVVVAPQLQQERALLRMRTLQRTVRSTGVLIEGHGPYSTTSLSGVSRLSRSHTTRIRRGVPKPDRDFSVVITRSVSL